jgi:hypothetical protein
MKIGILAVAILLSISIIGCHKSSDDAGTISFDEIKNKIESADDGETVEIPAGTLIVKNNIIIDKKIIIKGSGIDKTIFVSNISNAVIDIALSGSRVTEIKFVLQKEENGIGISVRGNGWRVDHCYFENQTTTSLRGVSATGNSNEDHPVGVIDHCEFVNTRVVVLGDMSLMANKIWNQPLNLGSNNAVFIEDCVFTKTFFGNCIDSNYGGKYVFRHNILNDCTIEAHSVQGNNRASRSWEIYSNTINQINRVMWCPFLLRGGTGVVFNNTINGNWTTTNIALDNVRSEEAIGDGGLADGTSPWDGNEDSTGYPARDQIGRSTDSWLWTTQNPYPSQTLDPAYCWNNKYNSNDVVFFVHNAVQCDRHIKENRDFYNNKVKSGYTPYTYPHPLTKE